MSIPSTKGLGSQLSTGSSQTHTSSHKDTHHASHTLDRPKQPQVCLNCDNNFFLSLVLCAN